MYEATWTRFTTVRSEDQRHFAAQDLDRGGHGRRMGGQLLARGEPKHDDLGLLIVVQRMAQDSLRRNLNLAKNALGERVAVTHHGCIFLATIQIAVRFREYFRNSLRIPSTRSRA